MRAGTTIRDRRQWVRAVLYGAISLGLYAGLFLWEKPLAEAAARGGWYFLLPVAIAFLFSFAHGTFTGCFWDALGVQAKR